MYIWYLSYLCVCVCVVTPVCVHYVCFKHAYCMVDRFRQLLTQNLVWRFLQKYKPQNTCGEGCSEDLCNAVTV